MFCQKIDFFFISTSCVNFSLYHSCTSCGLTFKQGANTFLPHSKKKNWVRKGSIKSQRTGTECHEIPRITEISTFELHFYPKVNSNILAFCYWMFQYYCPISHLIGFKMKRTSTQLCSVIVFRNTNYSNNLETTKY